MKRHSGKKQNTFGAAFRSKYGRKLVLLATIFWFSGPGFSQPVTVPGINPPTFQSNDADPVAESADGTSTQHGWEHIVDVGLQALATAWETGVDASINALVAGVGQADFFNNNANYRDYLQRELELQKQARAGDWELAAETAVEARRTAFLASLSERNYETAAQNSADALHEGNRTADNADLDTIDQERYFWNREFQEEYENGYRDFQSALNGIQSDYDRLIAALDQKEQEFQQGRIQIDQYEQTVRGGIQQAVNGLSNMLNNSGMFHDEICDAQNVCTQGALSTSGQQLQTLLGDIQNGLQNNAPLSTLSQQMVTFLQQQHTYSVNRQQFWQNQIHGTGTYVAQNQGGAFNIWGTICDPFCHPAIVGVSIPQMAQNVLAYHDPANPGASDPNPLMNWLMANHESLEVTGINTAYFVGHGNYIFNHWLGANDIVMGGGDSRQYFDVLRNNTFAPHPVDRYNAGLVYLRFQLWASFSPASNHVPEFHHQLDYYINYNTYDANADANATTWQGYVNNLDGMLQHWQNDILPAIQNWETQTASYHANFATWQAQAQTQRAQALSDRRRREQEVLAKRNYWVDRMESRRKEDGRQWDALRETVAKASSISAAANDPELSESTRGALQRLAASRYARNTGLSARDFQLGYRKEQVDLLQNQNATIPDGQKLLEIGADFQKSLQGGLNLTLARTLDQRAERQRQAALEQVFEAGRQQDGLIAQQRNLPQAARDIDSKIKDLNKEKRRVLNRVYLGQNVDFIMEKNTNDEGRIAHILGGADRDQVKAIEDQIEQLRRDRAKVLAETRKDYFGQDANFSVTQEGGTVIVRRTMSTGRSTLAPGGFAEDAEAYQSIDTLQTITLATPGAVKLVETGDLFGDWDYGQVMQEYAGNASAYGQTLNSHFQKLGKTLENANQVAMAAESAWRQDAQDKATQAKKNRMMLESIFKAVMGGAGLGDAVYSVVKDEVMGQIAQQIGEATGLPVGLLAGMLGGADPMDALASHMKTSLLNYWESESGVTGLGSWLGELHAKQEAKKARRAAAKLDMSDLKMAIATGGLSITTSLIDAVAGPNTFSDQLKAVKPFGIYPSINQVQSLVDGDIPFDQFVEKSIKEGPVEMLKNTFTNPGKALASYVKGIPGIAVIQAAAYKPPKVIGPGERAVRQGLVDLAAELNPAVPRAFASAMFVDGADMKQAMVRQAAAHLATGMGAFGDSADLLGQVLGGEITKWMERQEMKKQRANAAALKPEDFATMGLTYAWRNAQYHKEGGMLLDAVETVGSVVANAFPVVGHAIYGAYQGVKGAYLNVSQGGGIKGLITSAVGKSLSGMLESATMGTLSMGLDYNKESGFGGTLSVGAGPAKYNMNFREGAGYTGSSFQLSHDHSNGRASGSFTVNMDAYGNYMGSNLGIKANGQAHGFDSLENTRFNASLGMSFGADGKTTGWSAGLDAATTKQLTNDPDNEDYVNLEGFLDGIHKYSGHLGSFVDLGDGYLNNMINGGQSVHTVGVGLSHVMGGDTTFTLNQGLALENKARGLSKFGASSTSSYGVNTGARQGYTTRIDIETSSIEEQREYILARQQEIAAEIQAAEAAGRTIPAERLKQLQREASELQQRDALTNEASAFRAAMTKAGFSPEEIASFQKKPELMHDADIQSRLRAAGIETGESRGDWDIIGGALGWAEDNLKSLAGVSSTDLGEIDPATGEFRVRTCFVAGTLVRTEAGYRPIESLKVGDRVLSWNEVTGEITYSTITETFVHSINQVYDIKYDDGTTITATWNHPFYIAEKGWTLVRDLKTGDDSLTSQVDHRLAISEITTKSGQTEVYNIHLDKDHTYFVSQADVLVHNYDPEPTKHAGSYDQSGLIGSTVERFSNLWNHGSFDTDAQRIAAARRAHGLVGEFQTALELGYELTPEQKDAAARLEELEYSRKELQNKYITAENEIDWAGYLHDPEYMKLAREERELRSAIVEPVNLQEIRQRYNGTSGQLRKGWEILTNGILNQSFKPDYQLTDTESFDAKLKPETQREIITSLNNLSTSTEFHNDNGRLVMIERGDVEEQFDLSNKLITDAMKEDNIVFVETMPGEGSEINRHSTLENYVEANCVGSSSSVECAYKTDLTERYAHDDSKIFISYNFAKENRTPLFLQTSPWTMQLTPQNLDMVVAHELIHAYRIQKDEYRGHGPIRVEWPEKLYDIQGNQTDIKAIRTEEFETTGNLMNMFNEEVWYVTREPVDYELTENKIREEHGLDPRINYTGSTLGPGPIGPVRFNEDDQSSNDSTPDRLLDGGMSILGTATSAVTWPVGAVGRSVVWDGIIAPLGSTFLTIGEGIGRHMGHDYDDLTELEKRYAVRNMIAEELGRSPSSIDLEGSMVQQRLNANEAGVQSALRTARKYLTLGILKDKYSEEADRMLDHKETMDRKVDLIRSTVDNNPDSPEEGMAMVTRDEYGYIQVFDQADIRKSPALQDRFFKDRPRVLIHGKNTGEAGENSFDLDSMADYGNTISLFRDASKTVEEQAQDLNAQLLRVNENRETAGFSTAPASDQSGFNIAAHSMGNPVLLHLLAGAPEVENNVFREPDGSFRYSKKDGNLNIIGVAPAVGSNLANVLQSTGAGFARAIDRITTDSDSTRDLQEQNFDYLIQEDNIAYSTRENYRLAREQFSSVMYGTRPGLVLDNGPVSWLASSGFGNFSHDILVEENQVQKMFSGLRNGPNLIETHTNHEEQLEGGVLMNAPLKNGSGSHNFIAEVWSPLSPRDRPMDLPCSRDNCWGPAASLPDILPSFHMPGSPFRIDNRQVRTYAPTFPQLPPGHPPEPTPAGVAP